MRRRRAIGLVGFLLAAMLTAVAPQAAGAQGASLVCRWVDTGTRYTISWDAYAGATRYVVFRSVNAGTLRQRKAIAAPRLSTVDAYPRGGGTVSYVVAARNRAGTELARTVCTDATPPPPPPPPPQEMSAVEVEIARLVNELRTNPTGPEARTGPLPSCVATDANGRPLPVPALSVSEPVSIELARDWSIAMNQAGVMSHRPSSEQFAIYARLGISVSWIGENVAWFSGYPDSQAARVLFQIWRESSGHYCNMMSTSFTHIGVGVHKGASRTWGTQNLYSLSG